MKVLDEVHDVEVRNKVMVQKQIVLSESINEAGIKSVHILYLCSILLHVISEIRN